ncbi:hypothetical protein [Pendulispora albinea]|uniref:Lipoprotein n=1 Tax=Pendulispora albinea TaxID=2741071 RepID=A0ABZ2LWL6_9BACT
MKANKVYFVLASILGLACGPLTTSGCAVDEPAETAPEQSARGASALEPTVKGVSELRARAGRNGLLRDEPATVNFDRVRAAFEQKQTFAGKLGIYELAPVADSTVTLRTRAAELGINGEIVKKLNHAAISDGVNELRIGDRSGAEIFLLTNLFHQGEGTYETKSDEDYVALATRRAEVVGKSLPLASLYPYKVRRYKNAVAENEGQPDITTYQIAVAFNQSIDDLPLIGSGGKLVIHMATDGTPVGHESVVRSVQKTVKELDGSALSDPRDAQAEVEARLARRGVDPRQYRVVRSEFGYYRLGRDNTQNVVAPHYGFFYEPVDGVSKKVIEFVPALKDSSLRGIAERDVSENDARKAAHRTAPDARR